MGSASENDDEIFLFALVTVIGAFSLVQYLYLANTKVREASRATTLLTSFLLFYGLLSAFSCSDSAFCLSQDIDPRWGRLTYMGTAMFISALVFCVWKMMEYVISIVSVMIGIALLVYLFHDTKIQIALAVACTFVIVLVYVFLKDRLIDAFVHVIVSFTTSFNLVYVGLYAWAAAWSGVPAVLDDVKKGRACMTTITCLAHVLAIFALFFLRITALLIYKALYHDHKPDTPPPQPIPLPPPTPPPEPQPQTHPTTPLLPSKKRIGGPLKTIRLTPSIFAKLKSSKTNRLIVKQ